MDHMTNPANISVLFPVMYSTPLSNDIIIGVGTNQQLPFADDSAQSTLALYTIYHTYKYVYQFE